MPEPLIHSRAAQAPAHSSPLGAREAAMLTASASGPGRFALRPFFFADGLFGAYYAPRDAAGGTLPVLVCPPVGHEYVRSYNAIRKLCERLSRGGIPAFKFDYRGLGDSHGLAGEGDVEQWRDDLCAAAAELARLAGKSEITIVGLRLGAALAAGVRIDGATVRNLILWDPVVDGAGYLATLRRMHEMCLVDTRRFREQQPHRLQDDERLGFPLPPAAQASIAALRLLNRPFPYDNCCLVTSSASTEYTLLAGDVRRNTRGRFTHEVVAEPGAWDDHGRIESALIANRVVAAIAAKIASGFV